MSAPLLSVVIVGFDMGRELPRTVRSMLPPYQRGLALDQVEIIVADNGSATPVRRADFDSDASVTVIRVDDGGASPCRAINRAAALARGEHIAVVIDGARMATPGLLATALATMRIDPGAFVATLGFHLGPRVQQISVTEGYDRDTEDALLAGIGWPDDGYRLFEICALGESYADGVLAAPPETTFFVMARDRFQALGGFNEDFRQIGGGFANYDFFARAVAAPDASLVMLIGEGTFHQLHYGATTRADGIRRPAATGDETLAEAFAREYLEVTGRPHDRAWPEVTLHGRVTHPAVRDLFFPASR